MRFRKHKAGDGSVSFTATVRVAGFDSVTRTFPTRTAAAEWFKAKQAELQALRRQQQASAVRADVTSLTLSSLILKYLGDSEVQKLRSFDDLHRLLCEWIQECGGVKVLDCSVLTWREGRDRLHRGRGPATTNRYVSAMRGCWNWARAAGLIPTDRVWPPKLMLREPAGRQRYLSDAELERLLKAAKDHSAIMHAAVVTSVATGLRLGELLRIDWKDIDFERQVLKIHVTKTDAPRQVHLTRAACDALKALQAAKVRAIAGPVFVMDDGTRLRKSTLQARWKEHVRKDAALEDFTWHDIRHSCASFLAQAGANLFEIGSTLGHKSPSVTQRYSHLIQGAPLPAHAKLEEKLRGKTQ